MVIISDIGPVSARVLTAGPLDRWRMGDQSEDHIVSWGDKSSYKQLVIVYYRTTVTLQTELVILLLQHSMVLRCCGSVNDEVVVVFVLVRTVKYSLHV